MIASARDATRTGKPPLRPRPHVHKWEPTRPGSLQSVCTICWTVTWNQPPAREEVQS